MGVASLWDLAVPQGGSWIAGQEGLSVRQRQTSKKTVETSTEHSHGVLQGCRCRRGSLGGLQSVVVITPHPAPAVPPTPICSGKSPAPKQVHVPCISCWEHGQKGRPLESPFEMLAPSCWLHHTPAPLRFLTSPTQVPTQGQWWSNLLTQLSQTAQWEQRGGRKWWQVVHHLVVTSWLGATSNLMPGFGPLHSRVESHLQCLSGW